MAIKFTQVVDVANQRITSVGSPSSGTDAANKTYVDNIAQGLTWKAAARVASTGNVTVASPGTTIDGVTLTNGDRVLLKNQTTGSENGIYVFNGSGSAMTRAADADSSAEVVAGTALSIAEGTVNADVTFVLVTNNPITLGSTTLTFSLMNGGTGVTYTQGDGIGISGGVISVTPASGGGISVSGSGVAVDTSVVVRKFAANVGDGSSTTITVNHGLATRDVVVEVYTNGTPWDTVFCEVQRTDTNNVALVFAAAPASAAYRCVVNA